MVKDFIVNNQKMVMISQKKPQNGFYIENKAKFFDILFFFVNVRPIMFFWLL